MHLAVSSILRGALFGLIIACTTYADGTCDNGPFESSSRQQVFGAKGYYPKNGTPANPFCDCKWNDGLVVTGIEVWADKYHIAGVQFTYSDGSLGQIQGNTAYGNNKQGNNMQNPDDKYHNIMKWNPDDKITLMEAATSDDGFALGYLHIEVGGQTLEVGDRHKPEQTLNVGSGLLLGAVGEIDAFPSAWTPLFLAQTDGTAMITNITFDVDLDEYNKNQTGIQQIIVQEEYIQNTNPMGSNGTDQAWMFSGSTLVGSQASLSTTKMSTFGLTLMVGFEVELPVVKASTSVSAEYQYSSASTVMATTMYSNSLTWSADSTDTSDLIPPGSAQHCKAISYQGSYDGKYTSTVAIVVDGNTFNFQQKGDFKSISWTECNSQCNLVSSKDIPGNENVVGAPSTLDKQNKHAIAFTA